MANVYVLRYSLPYESTEMVSVYDNFNAVMNRLEITRLHDNFDEGESFTIECMEVTTEAQSLERLNNIRKHYAEKNSK
jgi:hypothetical protein